MAIFRQTPINQGNTVPIFPQIHTAKSQAEKLWSESNNFHPFSGLAVTCLQGIITVHIIYCYPSLQRSGRIDLKNWGKNVISALLLLLFVLIINKALYLPFFRCHMTLHLSECPEKAVKCPVAGCTAIICLQSSKEHVVIAASSHTVLQAGEVQQLRGIIHFKVWNASFSLVPFNVVRG